jgi:hypothetical protein
MEYVEGEDLSRVVKARGPLPVANACFYARQAALGLEHAREKGMVHRDIKPQNLILAREGKRHTVKILDFGLAKASCEKGGQYELTGAGKMLGTPYYIAPEQIRDAASADIRADIYSLGCTLYCLLAGSAPFTGGSLWDILQAHQEKVARPLDQVRPDVPAGLAAVVAKMMAKDPAERYQTPGEVAQALVPFIRPGSGTVEGAAVPTEAKGAVATGAAGSSEMQRLVTPTVLPQVARPPQRSRWLIGGGVAAIALVAGLAALWAGGVFTTVKVETGKGTLVVEVNQPDAEILVDDKVMIVTWQDGGKRATIQAEPGTHDVKVSKNDFTVFGQKVTLQEGRQLILTATLEPNPAPAAAAVPVPAPTESKASEPVEAATPRAVEEGPGRGRRGRGRAASASASAPTPTNDAPATPLAVAPVAPTPPAKSTGFAQLFNGRDLSGWQTHPSDSANWAVEGGMLVGRGPRGHLFSVRGDYENFVFRVEAMINEHGNSGQYFRTKFGPSFPKGYEAQINFGHEDPVRTGSLYGFVNVLHPAHKADEWFTQEVTVVGNHIVIKVNGKTEVDFVDPKNTYTTGHFALQQHDPGTVVKFRKIEVKELPPEDYDRAGFVQLFNGKDLAGWKPHRDNAGDWQVHGGILTGRGPNPNLLFTERENFSNFHLRVEARVSSDGESGVCFHTPMFDLSKYPVEDMAYEALINNDPAAGSVPRTGSLLNLPCPPVVDKLVPEGEWFVLEIIANDRRFITKVNGKTTADAVDEERKHSGGRLGLLVGNQRTLVEFRKIEIKDMVPEKHKPVPTVLATVAHGVTGQPRHNHTLFSNGHVDAADSPNTWKLQGRTLVFRWPNAKAPGKAWVDTCVLSSDGKTYAGHNQNRTPVSGASAPQGDLAHLLRPPPASGN